MIITSRKVSLLIVIIRCPVQHSPSLTYLCILVDNGHDSDNGTEHTRHHKPPSRNGSRSAHQHHVSPGPDVEGESSAHDADDEDVAPPEERGFADHLRAYEATDGTPHGKSRPGFADQLRNQHPPALVGDISPARIRRPDKTTLIAVLLLVRLKLVTALPTPIGHAPWITTLPRPLTLSHMYPVLWSSSFWTPLRSLLLSVATTVIWSWGVENKGNLFLLCHLLSGAGRFIVSWKLSLPLSAKLSAVVFSFS